MEPEPAGWKLYGPFHNQQPKGKFMASWGCQGNNESYSRYATLAAPLTHLTQKSAPTSVVCNTHCGQAFRELKKPLCSTPVFWTPNFTHGFVLHSLILLMDIEVVVSQLDDDEGQDHPIANFTRILPQSGTPPLRKNAWLSSLEIRLFEYLGNHL